MTVTSILYPLFVLVLKEVSVSFSAYTFGSGARVWCYAVTPLKGPLIYAYTRRCSSFPRVVAFMSLSQLVTQISGLPCLMTWENYGARDKWDVHLQLVLALSSSLLHSRFLCRHAILLLSLVLLFDLKGQEFYREYFQWFSIRKEYDITLHRRPSTNKITSNKT